MSAKNIILQPGPTDGSWSVTTKVSIDGNKEYTQAGIVAYASTSAWAKVVVMRRPNGTWTTELGRQSGYANADLPANAQKAITLQMYARDGQLRGRYSLDDGATWTEIGDGFDTSGLGAPSVGLAAYNGTGSETATFEAFTVGEPPELPPVPPCETPNVPEAGYSALFDGTDASLAAVQVLGQRQLRPPGLHDQVRRRVRPHVHQAVVQGALLAQARLDDARGRQLRHLRGLPRHRGEHGRHVDQQRRRDPDRPDGQPGADHRRDLPRAGRRTLAARDAALKPAGQWNSYELIVKADRIIVILNGVKINEWIDDDPVSDLADGHIGLQMHGAGDDVFFRNVRVKQLEESVQQDTTLNSTVPATLALSLGAPVLVRDVHPQRGPHLRGLHDGQRHQHRR